MIQPVEGYLIVLVLASLSVAPIAVGIAVWLIAVERGFGGYGLLGPVQTLLFALLSPWLAYLLASCFAATDIGADHRASWLVILLAVAAALFLSFRIARKAKARRTRVYVVITVGLFPAGAALATAAFHRVSLLTDWTERESWPGLEAEGLSVIVADGRRVLEYSLPDLHQVVIATHSNDQFFLQGADHGGACEIQAFGEYSFLLERSEFDSEFKPLFSMESPDSVCSIPGRIGTMPNVSVLPGIDIPRLSRSGIRSEHLLSDPEHDEVVSMHTLATLQTTAWWPECRWEARRAVVIDQNTVLLDISHRVILLLKLDVKEYVVLGPGRTPVVVAARRDEGDVR